MVTPAHYSNTNAFPGFLFNGASEGELAAIAKRKGICARCGTKTHRISVFKQTPITNIPVYRGICIKCNPTYVPAEALQQYRQWNPFYPRTDLPYPAKDKSGGEEATKEKKKLVPNKREIARLKGPLAKAGKFGIGGLTKAIAAAEKDGKLVPKEQSKIKTGDNDEVYPGACIPEGTDAIEAWIAEDKMNKPKEGNANAESCPMTFKVLGCNISDANGVYKKDMNFQGPYNRYTKEGVLNDCQVAFLFHRSSTRWFLSAVFPNEGRVYLYSAPAKGSMISPPIQQGAWIAIEGKGSLKLKVLTSSEIVQASRVNRCSDPAYDEEQGLIVAQAVGDIIVEEDEDTPIPRKPDTSGHTSQEPEKLRIQAISPTGKKIFFFIQLQFNCSLRQLKEEIERQKGVPIAEQLLTLTEGASARPLLDDDTALLDYNISGHTPIDLCFPKGGLGYFVTQLLISYSGEIFMLGVGPHHKIETLKEKIQSSSWFVEPHGTYDLALTLDGKPLEDSLLLVSCVRNLATLELEIVQQTRDEEDTHPLPPGSDIAEDMSVSEDSDEQHAEILERKTPDEDNVLIQDNPNSNLDLEDETPENDAPLSTEDTDEQHAEVLEMETSTPDEDDVPIQDNQNSNLDLEDETPENDAPPLTEGQQVQEERTIEEVLSVEPDEASHATETEPEASSPAVDNSEVAVAQQSSEGNQLLETGQLAQNPCSAEAPEATAHITLDESNLVDGYEDDDDIPVAIAVAEAEADGEADGSNATTASTPSGWGGFQRVAYEKALHFRDPRNRKMNHRFGNASSGINHNLSRANQESHNGAASPNSPLVPLPASRPGLRVAGGKRANNGVQQSISKNVAFFAGNTNARASTDSTLASDFASAASNAECNQGQVPPVGGDSETLQKWTGLLKHLERQIDPNRSVAQYTELPTQYAQSETAKRYHRAFENAFFATVKVMEMQSQGVAIPGPSLWLRLVRIPCQSAGFLVQTIGEMIGTIIEWREEEACKKRAKQFLEALPAWSGVTFDRYATKLSCLMVHAHMQRSSNKGIDAALSTLENEMIRHSVPADEASDTDQSSGVPIAERIASTFGRWQKAVKQKARAVGLFNNDGADDVVPEEAAAVVHVGMVARMFIEQSEILAKIASEGSPEEMVCRLLKEVMDISCPPMDGEQGKQQASGVLISEYPASPATKVVVAAAADGGGGATLDGEKLREVLEDVEQMKQKVERLEEERDKKISQKDKNNDNMHNRVRRTVNRMQVLEAGVGEASVSCGGSAAEAHAQAQAEENDPNRLVLFDCQNHGEIDAQRSELAGEQNNRISQLEAQLAATQDQVVALLEIVAMTTDDSATSSSSGGRISRSRTSQGKRKEQQERRVNQARMILQGMMSAAGNSYDKEDDDFGYRLEEDGTFESC